MDKLKYREKYKDFPEIPTAKRWKDNKTDEQIITMKLLQKQPVSEDERMKIRECIDFYSRLIPKLKSMQLDSMSEAEIEEFLEYYYYAFTFILMIVNDLHINKLFRIVKNESVVKKKERIRDRKHLTYPPIDIVRKTNKYNRVNTTNLNLFYSTSSIDDALHELKPQVGDLVTIGEWIPKIGDKVVIISYPICPNPTKYQVNHDTSNSYYAFKRMTSNSDTLLSELTEIVYNFINDEFAKETEHHQEYLFSALFAERLIKVDEEAVEPDFNIECIIYPSIGNKLAASNLALKPSVIDDKFKLSQVFEFEITDTHYEQTPPRNIPEEITAVSYKNLETSDWVLTTVKNDTSKLNILIPPFCVSDLMQVSRGVFFRYSGEDFLFHFLM